jgi:C-terminal processing protease CtpA/Prc
MKQAIFSRRLTRLALLILLLISGAVSAQDSELSPAEIVNDEGGAVSITGEVTYTYALFTDGVAQPLVILEDQAGFVDRDRGFLMPVASQVMGQITSDFYDSPFSYSVALPIQPQGTYRDVDNDGESDQGVQIYAVAYWTNTFGDPFLEERDLYGGGWSTAYASTLVSEARDTLYEIIGGKLLIYAADDEQGFSSGFGDDGLLFTEDDPTVAIPRGYTLVDLDTDPFTFDRSRSPVVDLIEPEGAALDDFSNLDYLEAFDAMLNKFRTEYAFTEHKGIDWDALEAEFRPRFEAAADDNDPDAYALALRDFLWQIPDGHVTYYPEQPATYAEFQDAVSGGIGIAIRDVDDGRVIVTLVVADSPAADAGIERGAEIIAINDTPIQEWVSDTIAYSSPFSSNHIRRLQQLRYATRFPFGSSVEVTYRNVPDAQPETVTLTAVSETQSFNATSFNAQATGFELPVEYDILHSGVAYVSIYSFSDNDLLTIQLWERLIQTLNINGVPGLIIDMRRNGGGSGFLADQMAAYFFDEPLELGRTFSYDRSTGEFITDEERPDVFYLPPDELRYHGDVAVLVGPACASACEFFSYVMTLQERAEIVGQYPTQGLGGSIDDFLMPDGIYVRITVGRAVDNEGNIHIEGRGVEPTIRVPVTEETLFSDSDPVLDAAVAYLEGQASGAGAVVSTEAGEVTLAKPVTGEIRDGERVRYTFTAQTNVTVTIDLYDETGELDPYLRVYDGDGELIAENDDIVLGEDLNSQIESLTVSAGETIIVEVATYADAGAGTYVLSVTEAN